MNVGFNPNQGLRWEEKINNIKFLDEPPVKWTWNKSLDFKKMVDKIFSFEQT